MCFSMYVAACIYSNIISIFLESNFHYKSCSFAMFFSIKRQISGIYVYAC